MPIYTPFFCKAKQNGFDGKITYINKEAAISILRRYLNFKKKIFLGVRRRKNEKVEDPFCSMSL